MLRTQLQNKGMFLASRPMSIMKDVANWEKANKLYYGPERDTKNFPHPVMNEFHPPTRMGIFPESWFTFFYEKTGVTGIMRCIIAFK